MPKTCVPFYPDLVAIKQDTSNADEDTPTQLAGTYLASWRCLIRAVGGDETYRGRQFEEHVDFVIEGPWVSGVTSEMQIYVSSGRGIFDGRWININHVRPKQEPGRTKMLEIYGTELAS